MKAEEFSPENAWALLDSCIQDIDLKKDW